MILIVSLIYGTSRIIFALKIFLFQNLLEKKTNSNTYLLHSNYEETILSNMQRKHHVH